MTCHSTENSEETKRFLAIFSGIDHTVYRWHQEDSPPALSPTRSVARILHSRATVPVAALQEGKQDACPTMKNSGVCGMRAELLPLISPPLGE